jgi:hypothetical protein
MRRWRSPSISSLCLTQGPLDVSNVRADHPSPIGIACIPLPYHLRRSYFTQHRAITDGGQHGEVGHDDQRRRLSGERSVLRWALMRPAGGQHDVPWYPHNRFVIRLVIAGHSVSNTVCREGGREEIS